MLFVSFIIGILFFIVKNPELSKASVILRAKANIIESADWKTFYDIMNLMIAIIGFLGFSVITTWTFGREYSDKTIKDIVSLPVSRSCIVIAKHIVIILWCIFLALILYLFSFIAAYFVGLNNFKTEIILSGFKTYILVVMMNIILVPVISFLSSYGRGYFLALGFIFLILLLTNFAINISENAKYLPWAIPLIYAGSVLKEGISINFISIVILLITCILGFISTIYFWKYGDQY